MISRMHFPPTFALIDSHVWLWRIFVALALLLCSVSIALAGPREQAARIHDRLAGVPADEATLNAMQASLPANPTAAASIAMSNPNFYAVTLKNFAAPWTNRDQNPFVPLNDYVTLVMGMVRDNVPFNEILTTDLLYTGPGSVTPAPSATSNAPRGSTVTPTGRPKVLPFAWKPVTTSIGCPAGRPPRNGTNTTL